MTKQLFFIIFLTICNSLTAFAQQPAAIQLENPSFEDEPGAGRAPTGWFNCGFAGETPPDVNPTTQFKVTMRAYHGETYMGMVTRDNNTCEAVGQKLKTPLLKGVTYSFSIYLARSEFYMSQSRKTGQDVNYTTPAVLRIWGGSDDCSKKEMIAQSKPVSDHNWRKFSFTFTPKSNHHYFMIEAFYSGSTLPYNGNILVDRASIIAPIAPDNTAASSDSIIFNGKLLVVDSTIETERIGFVPDKALIEEGSYSVLDTIYNLLATNPNLVIEIIGHTHLAISEKKSMSLSTARARAVAKYLIGKGINKERLEIKGHGLNFPIDNSTTETANKVNQRIEIKILSL